MSDAEIQIQMRALEMIAKEAERLADNTGRPLSDELYRVANEMRERIAEQNAKGTSVIARRKNSPLNRSGATGSSWPRLQNHLHTLSLTNGRSSNE